MNRFSILLIVVLLVGCATLPENEREELEREEIELEEMGPRAMERGETEPDWQPLVEGSNLMTDVNYEYYDRGEMLLSNDMLLRVNDWENYLQDFISSFPVDQRDAILRALSRFYQEYDRVEQVVRFEPLRYLSGPYSRLSESFVSLRGHFDGNERVEASAYLRYNGRSWIFAERVTVVADDFRWDSPQLDFRRDHSSGNVWEYVYLPLADENIREMIDAIASADEAIVRFHGDQYYSDLDVTSRMKEDIAAMLMAIDSVNSNR